MYMVALPFVAEGGKTVQGKATLRADPTADALIELGKTAKFDTSPHELIHVLLDDMKSRGGREQARAEAAAGAKTAAAAAAPGPADRPGLLSRMRRRLVRVLQQQPPAAVVAAAPSVDGGGTPSGGSAGSAVAATAASTPAPVEALRSAGSSIIKFGGGRLQL